jgi:hypothetical protein
VTVSKSEQVEISRSVFDCPTVGGSLYLCNSWSVSFDVSSHKVTYAPPLLYCLQWVFDNSKNERVGSLEAVQKMALTVESVYNRQAAFYFEWRVACYVQIDGQCISFCSW